MPLSPKNQTIKFFDPEFMKLLLILGKIATSRRLRRLFSERTESLCTKRSGRASIFRIGTWNTSGKIRFPLANVHRSHAMWCFSSHRHVFANQKGNHQTMAHWLTAFPRGILNFKISNGNSRNAYLRVLSKRSSSSTVHVEKISQC